MLDDVLKLIVCGFENSGTTLVSTVLCQHPQLDSGFEGGFLLGNTPREFPGIQPYFRNFKKSWEVSDGLARFVCDTDDWKECYRRARDVSPVIADKSTMILDKTPAYMRTLDEVLEKVPQVPCVVVVRDPRALLTSWANRTGFEKSPERWLSHQMPAMCARYLDYADGFRRANLRFPERIMQIQFEEVCLEPVGVLSKMFEFAGLAFEPSYTSFPPSFGVHGNRISGQFLYGYQNCFSPATCEEILKRTERYAQWHFTMADRDSAI